MSNYVANCLIILIQLIALEKNSGVGRCGMNLVSQSNLDYSLLTIHMTGDS